MRRASLSLAILVLLLAAPPTRSEAPYNDDNYSNARIVRLSLVEGDAQVFRPEEGGWEEALQNLPIQKGYAVATGRGRVEIEFESGATARLDEFTELEFTELALANGDRITELRLERGSAVFYANLEKNDSFVVLSGRHRVRVPRNARLRMDATDGSLLVGVLKGDVEVESGGETYKVSKNKELQLSESGGTQLARRGDADEFERWAVEREDVLTASRESARQYVNAPFRYGVGDLSYYGNWYYDASFGNVWRPWGIHSGWSPYVHGRWVWVHGHGWTWVSYEPWGWVPYHYGRWVLTSWGWSWVPGYFNTWSPGLVVWLRFGNGRLGWCPLSPWDRPGRRPRYVHHATAVMTGGRPVVTSSTELADAVVNVRPTRYDAVVAGFSGRPGRGDHFEREAPIRSVDAVGTTTEGPRSGFTGTSDDTAPRPNARPGFGGRPSTDRGDVRFDPEENKFVNSAPREDAPVRVPEDSPERNPRFGGRPRPVFSGSPAAPRGDENSGRPPRFDSDRGDNGNAGRPSAGFSGRPQSSGAGSATAPRNPRAEGPSRTPPSSGYGSRPSSPPPRSSAPPRSSPPPRASAPPRAAPPPSRGVERSSPPRSSPPPRSQPSSSARPRP
jgi:hypothetical protein